MSIKTFLTFGMVDFVIYNCQLRWLTKLCRESRINHLLPLYINWLHSSLFQENWKPYGAWFTSETLKWSKAKWLFIIDMLKTWFSPERIFMDSFLDADHITWSCIPLEEDSISNQSVFIFLNTVKLFWTNWLPLIYWTNIYLIFGKV